MNLYLVEGFGVTWEITADNITEVVKLTRDWPNVRIRKL